jgi:SAM-dependent methyltransferase
MYKLHDPLLLPGEVLGNPRFSEKTGQVKSFYEKIQFPGRRPLEQDSLIFLRKFSNLIRKLSGPSSVIRVLDAGCGTGNTSLALAAQFRHIEFYGIDLSAASIRRANNGAEEKGLSNVRFSEWNLTRSLKEKNDYQVILCFGVLHHTTDMGKVLKNLAARCSDDGTLFLWVYGKYGRYHHMLNRQSLALLLSVCDEDEDAISLTHEFIEKTGEGRVIADLLGKRSDDQNLSLFKSDRTWIADQFLNPIEHVLTIKKLLVLLKQAGLHIDEWIGVPKDLSVVFDSERLLDRYHRLSREQQLIVLDLILKMERYFFVLKKS